MNFISISFLVTFLCFFFIYWSSEKSRIQNFLLLLFNIGFYSLFGYKFLLLLSFVIIFTYISAIYISRENKICKKKIILTTNICVLVGQLFVFKYYNFFITEITTVIGINSESLELKLLMPVGISFYTFTTIGYLIDVYKEKIEACKSIVNYFLFISFFPLIMSGPIERSNTLLPQFSKNRVYSHERTIDGLLQIAWGVFKKSVIADNCSIIVYNAFANCINLPSSSLWIGAILYTIQIYCDFSGYSDIAIGISKLLGFSVKKNFNYPYFSMNVADFWRRWHMSLQNWFTDYIYIPLGGSRFGKWHTVFNTIVVFTVCGIWHGANWTFILWGFYHALLFVPLVLFASKEFRRKTVSDACLLPSCRELFQMGSTFLLITFGWIVFNAESISTAFTFISNMFKSTIISSPEGIGLGDFAGVLIVIVIFLLCEWIQRSKEHPLQFTSPGWIKAISVYVIIALMILFNSNQGNFIYVQF